MSFRRQSSRTQKTTTTQKTKLLSSGLILVGLVLIVAIIFLLKNESKPALSADMPPEEQLAAALQTNWPTFVFLHSTDCIPCQEMMGIVDQVYPEFEESVALVDVNVYDQRNVALMRSEGLQVIPTLVFYDHQGARQTHVGVMEPTQFRKTLQSLAQGS